MEFARQTLTLLLVSLAQNLPAGRKQAMLPLTLLLLAVYAIATTINPLYRKSASLKKDKKLNIDLLKHQRFGLKLCKWWKLHDYVLGVTWEEQSHETDKDLEKGDSLVHLLGIDCTFLIPHCCPIAWSNILQLEETPLVHNTSWPCLLKLTLGCNLCKRGVTAMGTMWFWRQTFAQTRVSLLSDGNKQTASHHHHPRPRTAARWETCKVVISWDYALFCRPPYKKAVGLSKLRTVHSGAWIIAVNANAIIWSGRTSRTEAVWVFSILSKWSLSGATSGDNVRFGNFMGANMTRHMTSFSVW